MPRIEILTIGDELIEGRLVDTNAGELSDKLAEAGLRAREHRTIGDDMVDMIEALRTAASRADAVLVSGGLGPTGDDLTAAAAATAFGLEVVRFDEALEHTRRFFTERGREMPPTNEKQADLPAGSTILPNPEGTAVGFRMDVGGCRLYFMPGVPRELRRMADESVLPDLAKRLPSSPPMVATLKLFGKGESEVAHHLEGLEHLVPPELGLTIQYRATFPEIHLRLVLDGEDETDGRSVLERLVEETRARLGHHVFASGGPRIDVDFPGSVANALAEAHTTVAAAEIASAGSVARMLGATAVGRSCLRGSVVASDSDGLRAHLELTRDEAEDAATEIRRRFGSTIGVATFGSPDDRDGSQAGNLVVAAAGPQGVIRRELYFPIDADRFQRLAAYAALKLAWRVAEGA